MASGTSTAAAPATFARPPRVRVRRVALPAAVIAGVALVLQARLRALVPQLRRALRAAVGARPLARAHAGLPADFAPTPHPLPTAVSSLALPFGDTSDRVDRVADRCSASARSSGSSSGSAPAVHAAGSASSPRSSCSPGRRSQRDALLAYQDMPFAALIVGAVLLEARRPRRGDAVLVVLAVAGLLRPEAWVLSGLYVLYTVARPAPAGARARCRARRHRRR